MSKKNKQARALAHEEGMNGSMPLDELESMPQEDLMDFDGWWASRQSKIPSQHRKEIIKADFRGRGLSTLETMEDFDEALKEYGIRLS